MVYPVLAPNSRIARCRRCRIGLSGLLPGWHGPRRVRGGRRRDDAAGERQRGERAEQLT
jgi:hypothetical protein